ncbi:MAG: sugar transferase [Oscillospiraceae bacterium]
MYRRKPQGWLKHIDFILLDLASLLLSFFLACVSRYGLDVTVELPRYVNIFSLYALLVVLFHIVNNTFSGVLRRGYYKEFERTVSHIFYVELVAVFYLFSTKESALYSRIVFYLLPVYYAVISYGTRLVWKRIVRKKGYFFTRTALYVVATKDQAEETIRQFRTNSKGEFEIQGICVPEEDCRGQSIAAVPVTSCLDTLVEFLCDKWVDEIYVTPGAAFLTPVEILDQLTEMGIVVHVELDKVGSKSWQVRQVQKIGDQVVQTLSMTNVGIRQAIVKRLMDIAGGIVGCLLTLLLTLMLAPLIWIQSPGPIFFSQIRVGKNGKKFRMYKFRSMYPDAEARKQELMKDNRISDGLMFKLDADPRIIGCRILPDGTVKKGIGNFIRDYSLDEFPQFFNVLRGDLSLVGTRPPTVDEWEKYHLHHRARLSIKPGITGMWQVSGRSKITDFEEVVELDKKYIREWSIGLDLRILLKTILVVLRRDGSM